jgi:regulator of nucleoside diphosphate kinase
MPNYDDIILTKTDFQKISSLIYANTSAVGQQLEEELGRASLVADDQLPENIVSMNSTVKFEDVQDGKLTVVTLVYPHEANIDENKISILTPVGSALIGLRVGQTIHWTFPNGKEKELKVISVARL